MDLLELQGAEYKVSSIESRKKKQERKYKKKQEVRISCF